MESNVCPKCNGTGRIVDKSGISTCFDCLASGKLDNYSRNLNSEEKPKLRLPENERNAQPGQPKPTPKKSSDGYIYY